MSSERNVLLVGGNGFIGSNLLRLLLSLGYRVRVYDRADSTFLPRDPAVEYMYGELGNAGLLAQALVGIDTVFHMVSTTLPASSNEDPAFDIMSNVAPTIQFLEACVRLHVGRVVFLSSGGAVYGLPATQVISEEHATNPICSYGIVKLTIEKYLALFHHLYGLNYVIVRPSNPYGLFQNPLARQGAVSVFTSRIMRNEPIVLWGTGEVIRDYLFSEDLSAALELLARADAPLNQVFNIGSGTGLSLNQLVETIERILGTKARVRRERARKLDVPETVLNIERAKEVLRWEPKTPLHEGIKATAAWLKEVNGRAPA